MEKPKIADRKPKKVDLEEGETYYFCACGRSGNQPFCDGSHKGSGITPHKFEVEEDQEAYLCMCKRTDNKPFCDGTHKSLSAEEIEKNTAEGDGKSGDSSEKEDQGEDSGDKDQMPSPKNTKEEPTVEFIHRLAEEGLEKMGPHGEIEAMGVPSSQLPQWKDLQILVAQLARQPLLEDAEVGTDLVIGPRAKKPLKLKIPLLVSDMSFGALSEEAKTALAKGAEKAQTGICSGEGGMLPEEQEANSRYLFELGSAKFGYREEILTKVQAFHFKGGQGAKTGTGGHLPASKVVGKIAEVRNLPEKKDAISPPTFPDLKSVKDFRKFADKVREISGGIPIGFKLSANHIEADIDFALEASADYIILDGRGGATGAAPVLFRDNISVPTIPALARARHYLDKVGRKDITLIITGGLRVPADFIKALCLGADGVALANASIQAVGCVSARICHTNNCPSGVATQKAELREKLKVDKGAERLARFFRASTELMKVMARACGHSHLSQFNKRDLGTWKREMAELTGVEYTGFDPRR